MSKKSLSGKRLVSHLLVDADPSKLVIERPQYYCQLEDVSMVKALKAVEEEGMSVRHASELFGVPKSTLYDRVSGRVQHRAHPGPSAYLMKEKEDELPRFLLRCANIGYL
uniref:HTH psq-type domain-containing protein n=1 Tax=Amphimedon queenslandica TaxID=400682 RepID=A0A1X7V1N7_AMPQE